MRAFVLTCAAVLIGAAGAPASAATVKYLVAAEAYVDRAGKPFTRGQLDAVALSLENAAQKELMRRFPCASTVTQNDVRAMLEFERMRQVLGAGSEEDLAAIGGAVGADHVVTFTIRQVNGRVVVSALQVDMRSGGGVARESLEIPAGSSVDDALEEVLRFGREFAGALDGPECNPWTGTITYSRVGERTSDQVRSGTTTVETDTWSMKYEIHIPEGGKPTLSVVFRGAMRNERTWSYEVSCQVGANRGIGARYEKRPGKAEEVMTTDKTGSATLPVEVRFDESPTELRVSVPPVRFETMALSALKSVRTSFCGDKDPSFENPGQPQKATLDTFPPTIPVLRLQPGQNDVRGQFPPADRPQPQVDPATRETIRTTWNLHRTGTPKAPEAPK